MYKSDQGRACTITLTILESGNHGTLHACDIMPDSDDDCTKPSAPSDPAEGFRTELPAKTTLETVIELTGELEHLNDLVLLALEKAGGFTCTEDYFATVQPILDLLEVEIRVRYQPGMSKNEMKLIIQDWIDGEIRELQ